MTQTKQPPAIPGRFRGSRVAAEATRQQGQLSQGVRGAAATARLNLPLAQSQLLQAGALGQQNLLEATRQFQEQLRNQAFQNRLSATGTLGGLGLGLATGIRPQFPNFAKGSTTTTTASGGGGFGFADILGGAGAFLSGIGAIKAASSRDLKTDKTPIDEDVVLAKVVALPIEAWRYKDGLGLNDRPHVGVYAQDFQETFGLGDGKTIDFIDTTGVTMAAIKSLGKKVERLEEGFGLNDRKDADRDEGFGFAIANDDDGAGFGFRRAA